jgi:aromatic amino acid permease
MTTRVNPAEAEHSAPTRRLAGTLRPRHLTMLALGGVIGSGLFVGSGAGIALAGPGIVLSFLVAGILAMLVMGMMAEMAAAYPSSGSFSAHAERAFGPWAGFTIGWLYWITVVVVLAVEATAAAIIVQGWLPAVPQWSLVLLFMIFFTAVNLFPVRKFGEFEFWFALIKIVAIVGFLALGVLAVLGVLPGRDPAALAGDLLPHGWSGVVAGVVLAVPAFGGLEVVTIASAESTDPGRTVSRAVRSAVWRILLFYVGSMTVIVALLPSTDLRLSTGPFGAVLDELGVPGAAQIMNLIILVALLSALNATMYAAARMGFSLADRRQAPAALTRLSRPGTPWVAVLASSSFGFAAVVLNLLWPKEIFLHLLNAVGTVLLLVWILVACSQQRLRPTLPTDARVRMWGHPYLSWLALATMAGLLVVMAVNQATRIQVISSAVLAAIVLTIAAARFRNSPQATAGRGRRVR